MKELFGSIKDLKGLADMLKQAFDKGEKKQQQRASPELQAPENQTPQQQAPPESAPALPEFQSQPQAQGADQPQTPVDEINKNRGQLYVFSDNFSEILTKLAKPESRQSFVKGLLSPSSWFSSEDPKCEQIYREVSNAAPVLYAALLAHTEGPNNGVLHLLNLLVKVDKIMLEMKKEGPLRRCLSFSDKDIHVFLVKLLLFGKEFSENSRSSFGVWSSLADAALMFQMEAFQSAGEDVADALKAVIATEVSMPDSELQKVMLTPCLMAIFKARNELPAEAGESLFSRWSRAAEETKLKCLTFAV